MTPPVIMAVNYCEQGQSIEETCRKAVEWGFDGVEFRREPLGIDLGVEAYLDAIARGAAASGLARVLFGIGVTLITEDAAARAEEIEQVIRFCSLAAQRMPLSVCNTAVHGPLRKPSASAPDEHWQWAAEGYKVLGGVAAEMGFRWAFEVHMGHLHDLPSPTMKLVRMIDHPAVGVNLDYGNVVYMKDPPSLQEAIAEVGDRLYHVHLKNSVGLKDGSRIPTNLGDGDINHCEYLGILKGRGYAGHLCPEAPRRGDREWYARQDIAYLKTLLADLEW